MSSDGPDDRPTIIALAGSNGAGKSTFYETQLASLGMCDSLVERCASGGMLSRLRKRRDLLTSPDQFEMVTFKNVPTLQKLKQINVVMPRDAEAAGIAGVTRNLSMLLPHARQVICFIKEATSAFT
jgi:hypothetical protein